MSLWNPFSRRNSKQQQQPLQHDNLSEDLRISIVRTWRKTLGESPESRWVADVHPVYKNLYDEICDIYPKFVGFRPVHKHTKEGAIAEFFLSQADTMLALDIVELVFRAIWSIATSENDASRWYMHQNNTELPAAKGIERLNDFLERNNTGYRFENGIMVRLESNFVHAELTKPALALLANPRFKTPNDEFLKAHEHFRFARLEECVVWCGKAFESIMKIICDKRNWQPPPRVRGQPAMKDLVSMCLSNGLIPDWQQTQMHAYADILSAVATPRNRGAHGGGSTPQAISRSTAAYQLHQTAAVLVLFAQSDADLP